MDGVMDEYDNIPEANIQIENTHNFNAVLTDLRCDCAKDECEILQRMSETNPIPVQIETSSLSTPAQKYVSVTIRSSLAEYLKPLIADSIELLTKTTDHGLAGIYIKDVGGTDAVPREWLEYQISKGYPSPLNWTVNSFVFAADRGQNCDLSFEITEI